MGSSSQLPNSESPDLHLSHPTPEECAHISHNTAASWRDSLTIPLYLAEAQYLTTVPLAEKGGLTSWILVAENLPPNKRQILCSCESFRKRSLISDENGNIEEGTIHGIASVFCPLEFRRRGYGTRHMKELAKVLHGWQSAYGKSIGSILYSDIGKDYYSRLGWLPHPRNGHYVFPTAAIKHPKEVQLVTESELEKLCRMDESMVFRAMKTPSKTKKRAVVLPNLDHMLWHIRKEDFANHHIFGKTPHAKDEEAGGNPLYILRLVVEGDDTANKSSEDQLPLSTSLYIDQEAALRAVLQAAQAEAAEWRLDYVALWEPSPLVRSLINESGLKATWVERQDQHIASALWFKEDGHDAADEAPVWINNEYYAWC
ncbi:hypothetical protein F5Y16DRAFT_411610 [Xylariaceae sp. FL0255]|nr:hypothetical protein F5Y16DRAFT_411610 [Xylariaceae sp. FL0255]